MRRRQPRSTLFPYTTLYRSAQPGERPGGHVGAAARRALVDVALVALVAPQRPPPCRGETRVAVIRSEEHTSELQSRQYLVCLLLLEIKTVTHHLFSFSIFTC